MHSLACALAHACMCLHTCKVICACLLKVVHVPVPVPLCASILHVCVCVCVCVWARARGGGRTEVGVRADVHVCVCVDKVSNTTMWLHKVRVDNMCHCFPPCAFTCHRHAVAPFRRRAPPYSQSNAY
jgi:hypothetical protein